jgi:hypothetical protein
MSEARTEKVVAELKYKDATAYIEGDFVMIGDSQDEIVLTKDETLRLREWLLKVLR